MYRESHWDVARWREASSVPAPPSSSLPAAPPETHEQSSCYLHHEVPRSREPGAWLPAPSTSFHGPNEAREVPPDSYSNAARYAHRQGQDHGLSSGQRTPQPAGLNEYHARNFSFSAPTPSSPPPSQHSPCQHSISKPWLSLQRTNASYPVAAPLTLDIPDAQQGRHQDNPDGLGWNARPTTDNRQHESQGSQSRRESTALPSFAQLQHYATAQPSDGSQSRRSPPPTNHPCLTCDQVLPLINEVADAALHLHEAAQTYCSKSATKAPDCPMSSPMHTLRWIQDRIKSAKTNLNDIGLRGQQHYALHPMQHNFTDLPSRSGSPPLYTMKRPAETDERFARPPLKRTKDDPYPEAYSRRPSTTSAPQQNDNQDFAPSQPHLRKAFSPPPTESAPSSAHPGRASPTLQNNPYYKTLPSPSTSAFPPSLPPPTAYSPSTSYARAPSSIHTTTTSSAASAHIAELQHTVTLKSLSLQSLQSEHTGMLQKLQRERMKSQAIEKKSSVAENEVHDLTGRNEELGERVRELEGVVEGLESKRDREREGARREKEQWGRMLEMGGRLQSKLQAEKGRLESDVRALLEGRGEGGGGGTGAGAEKGGGNESAAMLPATRSPSARRLSLAPPDAHGMLSTPSARVVSEAAVEEYKRKNAALQEKCEVLRTALVAVKKESADHGHLLQVAHSRNDRVNDIIAKALDLPLAPSQPGVAAPQAVKNIGDPSATTSPGEKGSLLSARSPKIARRLSRSPLPPTGSRNSPPDIDLSPAAVAAVARARSPEPAELGFEVRQTSQSPEELIQALGPVPVPSVTDSSSSLPRSERVLGKRMMEEGEQVVPAVAAQTTNSPNAWASVNHAPPTTSPQSPHQPPGAPFAFPQRSEDCPPFLPKPFAVPGLATQGGGGDGGGNGSDIPGFRPQFYSAGNPHPGAGKND